MIPGLNFIAEVMDGGGFRVQSSFPKETAEVLDIWWKIVKITLW